MGRERRGGEGRGGEVRGSLRHDGENIYLSALHEILIFQFSDSIGSKGNFFVYIYFFLLKIVIVCRSRIRRNEEGKGREGKQN